MIPPFLSGLNSFGVIAVFVCACLILGFDGIKLLRSWGDGNDAQVAANFIAVIIAVFMLYHVFYLTFPQWFMVGAQ